jgi:hypothetical protein
LDQIRFRPCLYLEGSFGQLRQTTSVKGKSHETLWTVTRKPGDHAGNLNADPLPDPFDDCYSIIMFLLFLPTFLTAAMDQKPHSSISSYLSILPTSVIRCEAESRNSSAELCSAMLAHLASFFTQRVVRRWLSKCSAMSTDVVAC